MCIPVTDNKKWDKLSHFDKDEYADFSTMKDKIKSNMVSRKSSLIPRRGFFLTERVRNDDVLALFRLDIVTKSTGASGTVVCVPPRPCGKADFS